MSALEDFAKTVFVIQNVVEGSLCAEARALGDEELLARVEHIERDLDSLHTLVNARVIASWGIAPV